MSQTACFDDCIPTGGFCAEVQTNQYYCIPLDMPPEDYNAWLENAQTGSIIIPKPGLISITKIAPLIKNGFTLAFYLALIIALGFLIWGSIAWITSGGDKTKYEEARNKITAALVGLAIIALAYLLIKLAIHFLGLPDIFTQGFNIPKAYD